MLAVFADEPGKAEMPYQYMDPRVSCRPLRKAVELRQHGLAGTIRGSTERRYRRELRCWFLLQREDVALSDISTVGFLHLYVDLAGAYAGKWGLGSTLFVSSIWSADKIVLGSIPEVAEENRWLGTNPRPKLHRTGSSMADIPDPAGNQDHCMLGGREQRHDRLPASVHGHAYRRGPSFTVG